MSGRFGCGVVRCPLSVLGAFSRIACRVFLEKSERVRGLCSSPLRRDKMFFRYCVVSVPHPYAGIRSSMI